MDWQDLAKELAARSDEFLQDNSDLDRFFLVEGYDEWIRDKAAEYGRSAGEAVDPVAERTLPP